MKKFQIKDQHGNIVDRNLSFEEALIYIDSAVGKYYIMEQMKEANQNDSNSL